MGTDLVLTRDMVLVLGLVVFTMTMFMFERIRSDATALVVLIALGIFKLVPGRRAVHRLLRQRGDLDHRHHDPRRRPGPHRRAAPPRLLAAAPIEGRGGPLILWTSGVAGLMSGFMQNPSVTALFLPVASRLSARTGVTLSRCCCRWRRRS
jgi:di/tricarboxylate transporter